VSEGAGGKEGGRDTRAASRGQQRGRAGEPAAGGSTASAAASRAAAPRHPAACYACLLRALPRASRAARKQAAAAAAADAGLPAGGHLGYLRWSRGVSTAERSTCCRAARSICHPRWFLTCSVPPCLSVPACLCVCSRGRGGFLTRDQDGLGVAEGREGPVVRRGHVAHDNILPACGARMYTRLRRCERCRQEREERSRGGAGIPPERARRHRLTPRLRARHGRGGIKAGWLPADPRRAGALALPRPQAAHGARPQELVM